MPACARCRGNGKNACAPHRFCFRSADWFKFFGGLAWQPVQVITSAEQSERINRPYPLHFPLGFLMRALPATVRRKILSLSGAVSLQKGQLQAKQCDYVGDREWAPGHAAPPHEIPSPARR